MHGDVVYRFPSKFFDMRQISVILPCLEVGAVSLAGAYCGEFYHSYLSATIGSTRMARMAGIDVAARAMIIVAKAANR
jgi:hypothetical protein